MVGIGKAAVGCTVIRVTTFYPSVSNCLDFRFEMLVKIF